MKYVSTCLSFLFAMLFLSGNCAAAPVEGDWTMTWSGGQGSACFRKDGSYGCRWHGTNWSGHWHTDSDGRMVVSEECENGSQLTWRVTWEVGSLRGKLDNGEMFELIAIGGGTGKGKEQ